MRSLRVDSGDAPGAPPAYLANGLVGLRIPRIPLPGGTALVNGFVGLSPEKGTEEIAPAPYPVGADLAIDQVWLSKRPDLARFVSQECDFACGELRSRFVFQVEAVSATVDVLTFCSRTLPPVVLQEVTVTVDRACRLELQAHLDQRGLDGSLGDRVMPARRHDAILRWVSRGGLSSVGAAYVSEFTGDGLVQRRRNDYGHEADMELTQYQVDAQPGKRCVLRQYAALVPSLMHGEPHWQASRMALFATWHGFDEMRRGNREAWDALWRGRPRLVGADDRWQRLADACFFYLHSSMHQGTPCSIAPFGLSRRAEYSGHVFWDTETFMYPPLVLTAPDAARAVLDFRSRQLPMARDNARLNGCRGVQFPWQAGNHGFEVSPFYSGAAAGLAEQHISLDIAFATAQYAHATGDDLFIRQQAWPILEGVAEWILSRTRATGRGRELLHITGVDESRDNIDNNAMTNGLAIVVLREAAALARRLGMTPPAAWEQAADAIYLPIDEPTRILRNNDQMTPADTHYSPETMMLLFPFGCPLPEDVAEATLRYHLGRARDYLGMPMNSANFAVWACRAGERALAEEFFEAGMMSRVVEPYCQLRESANAPGDCRNHTIFVTACGAFLTACLLGLTGLEFGPGEPAGWLRHPVCLPAGWEAVEADVVWARGRPWRLSARHGDARASLTPIS